MAKNCDDLLPTFLASICLACRIVPFHPMLSTDEIVCILEKIKPEILFCDASTFKNSKQIINKLKWNVNVFTFGTEIDGTESIANLLHETGDECNFM